jgi:ferredoxin
MPKVVFINEHRIVQVATGKNLKALAVELGINPHREAFRGVNCGYWGVCGACQLWVKPEATGAIRPPNLRERWAGMRGERRLACQVRVLGDIEVTTMAGGDDRLRSPRPIAAPPRPTVDATAKRKPVDAAATAQYLYGHPTAVGTGTRVPAERETAADEEPADGDSPSGSS